MAGNDRGRGGTTWRDGDELATAALAQLLQGTALQSELEQLCACARVLAILGEVKGHVGQITPALHVLMDKKRNRGRKKDNE